MNDRCKRNVHPLLSDSSTYIVCRGIDFSISCCKHELSIFVPALIGLIYSDVGNENHSNKSTSTESIRLFLNQWIVHMLVNEQKHSDK